MPYNPQLLSTYDDARYEVELKEITKVRWVEKIGKSSMTKRCYANGRFPYWVILVSTNEEILKAEVAQLKELGKHIPTVNIGPDRNDLIFPVLEKKQKAFAFMEVRFNASFSETKVRDDPLGNWFHGTVLEKLKSEEELRGVVEFIEKSIQYLDAFKKDIPDFQVAWDPICAEMLLFDPGYVSSQNNLEGHQAVLSKWREVLRQFIEKREIVVRDMIDGKIVETSRTASFSKAELQFKKLALSSSGNSAEEGESGEGFLYCKACNVSFESYNKLWMHRRMSHFDILALN